MLASSFIEWSPPMYLPIDLVLGWGEGEGWDKGVSLRPSPMRPQRHLLMSGLSAWKLQL